MALEVCVVGVHETNKFGGQTGVSPLRQFYHRVYKIFQNAGGGCGNKCKTFLTQNFQLGVFLS